MTDKHWLLIFIGKQTLSEKTWKSSSSTKKVTTTTVTLEIVMDFACEAKFLHFTFFFISFLHFSFSHFSFFRFFRFGSFLFHIYMILFLFLIFFFFSGAQNLFFVASTVSRFLKKVRFVFKKIIFELSRREPPIETSFVFSFFFLFYPFSFLKCYPISFFTFF